MTATPVTLPIVRHEGDLLARECETGQECDDKQWRFLRTECGESPVESARKLLDAQSPLDGEAVTVAGGPVECEGVGPPGDGQTVRLVSVLFDCEGPNSLDSTPFDWVAPFEFYQACEQSEWRAYDSVRPTVAGIESDREHGSATLSIRALEVLRDEATLLADDSGSFGTVDEIVAELVSARPSMAVVANRVYRAIAAADSATPDDVATAAHEAIGRAATADREAAARASEFLSGARVATLSRSGTVLSAIETASPEAVLVAESRPGGEGRAVAETVSGTVETTMTTDAAFPGQLEAWDADVLLIGADSILGNGRVVNKVGTFGATVTASALDIEVVVVAATAKIRPGTTYDSDHRTPGAFGVEDAPFDIANPTFEATPLESVDSVVTEQGVLDDEAILRIAAEHSELRQDR